MDEQEIAVIDSNDPIGDPIGLWIYETARGLVDKPEAVMVTASVTTKRTKYLIGCDVTDVGKLIGKQGRTARSIRTILYAIAIGQGVQCELDIAQAPKPVVPVKS